jgi:hypothetical protein
VVKNKKAFHCHKETTIFINVFLTAVSIYAQVLELYCCVVLLKEMCSMYLFIYLHSFGGRSELLKS